MGTGSFLGQSSLQKGRFFLSRLAEVENAEPFDPEAAGAYLEAAILFGKSAQYTLESRVKLKTTRVWGDFKCKFVSELRDVIVHEDGTASIKTSKSVTVYVAPATAIAYGGIVTVTGTRGNPTPWQRITTLVQRLVDKTNQIRAEKRQRKRIEAWRLQMQCEAVDRAKQMPNTKQVTQVHFVVSDPPRLVQLAAADPDIEFRPASKVVSHYLDVLEAELRALPVQS